MATDLPAIVIEAQAPKTPSTLASLGVAIEALRVWEKHEGAHAVDAQKAPPTPTVPFDAAEHATRIAAIESTLHSVRTTLDLADAATIPRVRAEIAQAYGSARAHPEDPEAPWLVAESLRMLARAELIDGDAEGAEALRARARAIDGGRLLGLSEGTEAAPSSNEPRVEVTLTLVGAPKGSVAGVDGAENPADSSIALKLAVGEHHLRVVLRDEDGLDGAAIFATWIAVGDAPKQTLTFRVAPPPPPCTRDDLAPAIEVLASNANGTFEVGCGRWMVVRAASAARAVDVRTCDAHACGRTTTWTAPIAIPHPPDGKGDGGTSGGVWSSPWTYVAIGAGAAAIGGIVAWRLGAFDRPSAPPPTWQWQGIGAKP